MRCNALSLLANHMDGLQYADLPYRPNESCPKGLLPMENGST